LFPCVATIAGVSLRLNFFILNCILICFQYVVVLMHFQRSVFLLFSFNALSDHCAIIKSFVIIFFLNNVYYMYILLQILQYKLQFSTQFVFTLHHSTIPTLHHSTIPTLHQNGFIIKLSSIPTPKQECSTYGCV
jgi:glycerol-3-phosphate acyltransferase PlsY